MVKTGHSHQRRFCIGPVAHKFRCGLPADGPQKLVLDFFKKGNGGRGRRVVVDIGRINILYFLVKKAFRKPYFTDSAQKFIEIVHRTAPFEPLVVQCKTLYDIIPQALRRPDPELRPLR